MRTRTKQNETKQTAQTKHNTKQTPIQNKQLLYRLSFSITYI